MVGGTTIACPFPREVTGATTIMQHDGTMTRESMRRKGLSSRSTDSAYSLRDSRDPYRAEPQAIPAGMAGKKGRAPASCLL